MKKVTVIIMVAAITAVFAATGCEKKEAQKPAEQSAPTMTSAPADMEKK